MITIDAIKQVTAEHFDIPSLKIMTARPCGEALRAKHIVIYLSWKYIPGTLRSIASELGLGDHSGIVYAKDTIERRMRKDARCLEQVLAIEGKLLSAYGGKVAVLALSGKSGNMKAYLDEAQSLRVNALVEEMGLQWVA